jgi:hypothetical protein
MKKLSWILIPLFAYGCSTASYIDGSNVLLTPASQSLSSISPDDVTIYLQPPKQDYEPIALLVANATVGSYSDIAKIETGLINELKRQAAATGANGVTDVVREVIAGDKILTVSDWGVTSRHNISDADPRLKHIITDRQQQGVISSDYLIIYRAKAISLSGTPIKN